MPTAIPLACFNPLDRFGRKSRYGVGFRALGRTELFPAVRNALFSSSAQLQKQAQKDGEEPAHALAISGKPRRVRGDRQAPQHYAGPRCLFGRLRKSAASRSPRTPTQPAWLLQDLSVTARISHEMLKKMRLRIDPEQLAGGYFVVVLATRGDPGRTTASCMSKPRQLSVTVDQWASGPLSPGSCT